VSPEVTEREIPEFKIEYLQINFSPRITAGRQSRKNLAIISPRPLTSILPTTTSCFSSSAFSRSNLQLASAQGLLPPIGRKDETNIEDDNEKPIQKTKSPSRYANNRTLASPRMNPMRKIIKTKNSMLT
jgi:hypothetical protein